MNEFFIEIFNFIFFNQVVEASGYTGSVTNNNDITATAISLTLKGILSLVPAFIVLGIVGAAAFLGLSSFGFMGSQIPDVGRQKIQSLLMGLPFFGGLLAVGGVIFSIFVSTSNLSAQDKQNVACIFNNNLCKHNSMFNPLTRVNGFQGVLYDIINITAGIGLALSVVWFVYAGYSYITSNGDFKKLEGAKTQIKWTGYGILLTLSSIAIVRMLTFF
jgi:hypothetical protein